MDNPSKAQLLKHIRDALNHLEDPGHLRRCPLAALLGVADRFDTPSALRRILTEAIESLEPSSHVPADSRAWRIYESMYYRYVEAYDQEAVAHQLGMSVRQLRREQQAALEALALRLSERYHVDGPAGKAPVAEGKAGPVPPTMSEDLAWLKDAPPDTPTDPEPTLRAAVDLARPLADRHGVGLQLTAADGLPLLAVDAVGVRQILLNLLGVAIPLAAAPGTAAGLVCISARPLPWEVEIGVRCAGAMAPQLRAEKAQASLDMACHLAGLCGGKLTVSAEGIFEAIVTLPALQQLPVLVVDDNAGALELLQRYAEGTRYRLVTTRDPGQALGLAEKLCPQVILLDVMMPRVDGWDVLVRLRQHPHTSHIPIIVCTILSQEDLALSLGASAWLGKPVTRQVLLAALDRQVALMETVSR